MPIGTPVNLGSSAIFDAGSTSINLPIVGSVAVGEKILVFAGTVTASTTVTNVTDTGSNTYTVDVSANATQNACFFISSAECTTALEDTFADAITVTFSGSRTNRLIAAVKVSGLATSNAFDKSATSNGTVNTWTSSATPATTQADEIVVGGCTYNAASASSNTPDTGLTEIHDFGTSDFVFLFSEYKIVSATGAQTVSGTGTNVSQVWNAAAATYKASSPPSASPPLRTVRSNLRQG
jgi:hypothetical protein